MRKIARLTPKQGARLVQFRAEYFRLGTSTERADRKRAEAAFARAYKRIGRKPVPTIWVDSPLSASILFSVLGKLGTEDKDSSLGDSLGAGLEDSVRANIEDILRLRLEINFENSLKASLRHNLRDSLWDSLLEDSFRGGFQNNFGASLENSLRESLRHGACSSLENSLQAHLGSSLLWSSLRERLWYRLEDCFWGNLSDTLHDSLEKSLRNSLEAEGSIIPVYTYWWGQQELYWIAFYKFCAEIGVPYLAKAEDGLDIMHEIGLSCMWWYPKDGVVIACERPAAICMDKQERLHNESGPAVAFRDGWKIYAIHNVRVPGWIVEHPEQITVQSIESESNTEIQRIMIERFGWEKYAVESGARIIDHDERWGTLKKDKVGKLFVEVVNRTPEPDGTFRKYILPVADHCEPLSDLEENPNAVLGEPQPLTARNAVASTFGLTGNEYEAVLGVES